MGQGWWHRRLYCLPLTLARPRIKLSVLYWHIIDSQSFPLEVGAFPELSAKGAYSSKEVYSLDDIQQIIQYANEVSVHVSFKGPGRLIHLRP